MSLNIAIIGAGVAGVSAANALKAHGFKVTIFEKSRGYGGRCATKRWDGHVVDHGAQYFTIRDARFRAAVEKASGESLARLQASVLDERGDELPDSGRWFHRDGNSQLVRDLARHLDVKTETIIVRAEGLLRRVGGAFDHVISTAPFPQTARLFEMDAHFDYVPNLTVLLAYRGEWLGTTRECYAISDHSSALAWSACENHKPGRIAADHTVMVAQMSEAFSREHLDRPPDEYAAMVRPLVEERWELPVGSYIAALGHRWRYARVLQPLQNVELPPGLHFTGDALMSSRIEDAWLAGATTIENNILQK